jgi:lipopolysaccharide/colanic/teichoic acid biosynthesis glycosyltransferase
VWYPAVKRVLDVMVALLALVLLAPLLLAVAVAVRLGLGPGIFFRQMRAGRHGRPFTLIKFRTMTDARDAAGDLLSDEARLTPLGRFLRSASLDELPELLNVLHGEMSLVGPRPLPVRYLDRYTPEQRRRHKVRPGITGWAQVNGRNTPTWEERFSRDVWYVDRVSFGLDVRIILMTFRVVLARKDIDFPAGDKTTEYLGPDPLTAGPRDMDARAVSAVPITADVGALPQP